MIELSDVRFRWHRSAPLLLDIPKLKIEDGERVFLEGLSGSGKTTLLNLLGGIVLPEEGYIEVSGTDLTQLTNAERDAFRADHIGIIFQMFNLIPYLSSLDNITLPCRLSRRRLIMARNKSLSPEEEALRLLMRMEIEDATLISSPAFKLSIGQQQRVAAARSLIGSPKLIIADEPTSALDHGVRKVFVKLLFNEVAETGSTLLFASHDSSLGQHFDRQIKLTQINRLN